MLSPRTVDRRVYVMGLLLIMSGLKAVTSGANEDVGAIGKAIIGTRVLALVDVTLGHLSCHPSASVN